MMFNPPQEFLGQKASGKNTKNFAFNDSNFEKQRSDVQMLILCFSYFKVMTL